MNKFKENVKKYLYNWINMVKLIVDKKIGRIPLWILLKNMSIG